MTDTIPGSRSDKYILDGHEVVPCDDLTLWALAFENTDRRVAQDMIWPLRVSTVFIGINMQFGSGPPLLFETMIFGENAANEMDESYQARCSTWTQAEAQHAEAVEIAKNRVAAAEKLLSS